MTSVSAFEVHSVLHKMINSTNNSKSSEKGKKCLKILKPKLNEKKKTRKETMYNELAYNILVDKNINISSKSNFKEKMKIRNQNKSVIEKLSKPNNVSNDNNIIDNFTGSFPNGDKRKKTKSLCSIKENKMKKALKLLSKRRGLNSKLEDRKLLLRLLHIFKNKECKCSSTEIIKDKEKNNILQLEQILNYKNLIHHFNPNDNVNKALNTLLSPIGIQEFFVNHWEKAPIYIKRDSPNYYTENKLLVSTQVIDQVLRENYIQFTKDLDITRYRKVKRNTYNPVGRAYPNIVWDFYNQGHSVRMLNPQRYIPSLLSINSTLQEFFGCYVGANMYLTPPNSQGFAPHYDDIEAFILQIEGKKRWRLYNPPKHEDNLARYSSKDFNKDQLDTPFMEVTLMPGDLLYFPRGTVHQARTFKDTHSLHITLSVYQKNSWGDFLEKTIPHALQNAFNDNILFRKGLPLGYLKYNGLVYKNLQSSLKENFKKATKIFMETLIDYMDIDKAVDQMAINHIHDYLPPVFTPEEKNCSVLEDGERMLRDGQVIGNINFESTSQIKLIRQYCLRLVNDDETGNYRLYYSSENSAVYHEIELRYLEISQLFYAAIEKLILHYPNFIQIKDLPVNGIANQIQLAACLWEKGLIVTKLPLCN